ncbi:MAG: hypothetical protein KF819_31185 [Labilithrix sp.]|nr:hypothetical protein [Labilithrix sp.]
MKTQSFDLFPVHVKVFDFEDDPELNGALLRAAQSDPELSKSTTGKSVLQRTDAWVERLRARFDVALRGYLTDVHPDRRDPFDIEAYAFFNYTTGSSFTPVHDHLVEADLVAIYYALAPVREEQHDTSYYAMDEGLLVLHDPRADARVDRRNLSTRDHFRIHPRANRLVVHPASLRHSVTPSLGFERLAVTCTVTVDRKDLFDGYVRYALPPRLERP